MEIQTMVLLIGAGLIGGVVNAIAGGATLIKFPAMLAAGLPPVVANASNAVAVTPGHLMAALTDRRQLPALDWRLAVTIATAFAGGVFGAGLLMTTSEQTFTVLVPALIARATLIFALGRRLRISFSQLTGSGGDKARNALLFPTCAYGGYFGAGLGVMLLAVLTVSGREETLAVNSLKNLLATIVSIATMTVFGVQGVIRWPETLVMLGGALCGGMVGSRLMTVLQPELVRKIVIMIGMSMSAMYAWHYWA